MSRASFLVLALSFFLFLTGRLTAQKSHLIPLDQTKINGIADNIRAGDTIWLQAGQRGELTVHNLTGSPEAPILIMNYGEKVIIKTGKDFGISFSNSVHWRLSGTGGKDTYGIEIASTNSQGVWIGEFSSFVEVDHLEIHNVGFAGIMAKTDPNCTRIDLRYFTMENLHFHDNYIYESGGEAFYVGYSWFPTRQYVCGEDSLLYSHEIHGVRIYNNEMHDTHWDGLQVGSSPRDVKLYNNLIYNYGLDNKLWQNHGVQIGAGTTGDFFNNVVKDGSGTGISFFGGGNNRLYNNFLINNGESAIYHNDKGASSGKTYQIVNNTIIRPEQYGLWLNATVTEGNVVANNLFIPSEHTEASIHNPDDHWDISNNLILEDPEEAKFVNAKKEQWSLLSNSPAIDAGKDISWLDFDHRNAPRPQGKAFDIGAMEGNSKPKPSTFISFEPGRESKMIILKNPVKEKYTFKVKNLPKKQLSYILYDGAGLVVMRSKIGGKKVKVDFSDQKQGIYYLSIRSEEQPVRLERIVKK